MPDFSKEFDKLISRASDLEFLLENEKNERSLLMKKIELYELQKNELHTKNTQLTKDLMVALHAKEVIAEEVEQLKTKQAQNADIEVILSGLSDVGKSLGETMSKFDTVYKCVQSRTANGIAEGATDANSVVGVSASAISAVSAVPAASASAVPIVLDSADVEVVANNETNGTKNGVASVSSPAIAASASAVPSSTENLVQSEPDIANAASERPEIAAENVTIIEDDEKEAEPTKFDTSKTEDGPAAKKRKKSAKGVKDTITVKITRAHNGQKTYYRLKSNVGFYKLMKAIAKKDNVPIELVRFSQNDGQVIVPTLTPDALNWTTEGSIIVTFVNNELDQMEGKFMGE